MLKHAEATVWCAFTGDWFLVPKQHGMMFCFFTSKMDQRWDRHPTANCYQFFNALLLVSLQPGSAGGLYFQAGHQGTWIL